MQAVSSKKPFSVSFEEQLLQGDCISASSCCSLLCLHGAGPTTTRACFDPMREALASHNIATMAFDFIGHGETGGLLQTSSLFHRTQQASQFIERANLTRPISIMASSMSGYTALRLLERCDVENLILIVPAVYRADVYMTPFDQGFSELIRQPKSWLKTDAWEILRAFTGRLLLIQAELDAVIPEEIIQRLYEAAENAVHKELYMIPQCPHKILEHLQAHPIECHSLNRAIVNFLAPIGGDSE